MAKLISKTYGDALFELAVEENKVDELMEEILELQSILKDNPEFSKLMNHPKISKDEKLQVIDQVFHGRISEELTGFFRLIVTKDRYAQVDAILDYFLQEVKQYRGIGVVYVTTAVELRSEQKQKIEERLTATTQYRKLEMHYRTETELIGGMVIRIGDRVVDSSIRTKLSELQKSLLNIQLA